MPYQAVLFDLDGTLLDTLQDLADAGNKVLESKGLKPHPVDAYRYFVGSGVRHLMERILPRALGEDEKIVDEAVLVFSREYAKNWQEHTRPYRGIPELLDRLHGKGCKLSILSNKPHDFTLLLVRELLGSWNFYPVFGQRDGVPKKPHPAPALEVARKLDMSPADILYVGDTGVDMRTAQQAGMDAVGVLWGFRDAEELMATGAEWLVQTPEELADFIEKSHKGEKDQVDAD